MGFGERPLEKFEFSIFLIVIFESIEFNLDFSYSSSFSSIVKISESIFSKELKL